jgi:isopentenyl-diphosphate Delta-isomerase
VPTSVSTTEQVVLLDDDGRATGTADKAEVHGPETPLHLAFSAYLFDADGRLLVTRRARGKRTFPGVWTNSVCGHPAPGETLPDAVRRRAAEELGLQVTGLRLVLPRFAYRAEMDGIVELEQCPVYAGWLDADQRLDLAPDEVEDAEWVPWADFAADVLAGHRTVSTWCTEQVPQLVALGPAPSRWPVADDRLLPPAARL